jgi:hypothetical protein
LHGADETCGPAAWNLDVVTNLQPLPEKSHKVPSEIARIPPAQPVPIQVADVDRLRPVDVTGRVADAVTRPRSVGGHFSFRPEFDAGHGRPLLLDGELSLSGEKGRLAYTIDLGNEAVRRDPSGLKLVYGPEGDLVDYRDESQTVRQDKLRFSANLKYEGPDSSTGNLNLSFGKTRNATDETSDRTGRGLVHRTRYATDREGGTNWELGFDYQFGVAAGQLKMTALLRSDRIPRYSDVTTYFADASPPVGSRFLRASAQKEAIGRAEFRWKSGSTEWQWSAQGAFNRLEVVGRLLDLSPDRSFIEAALDGESGSIREDRGETEIGFVRPLGRAFTLHGLLGAEVSRLRLASPARAERRFLRPQGSVVLDWAVSPRLAVKARLARSVGQLNFLDFFSSKQLHSGDVTSGNPGLVPPLSWDAEIETRRTFGAFGSGTLRLYAQRITDVIDYVKLDLSREAAGNLDRASLIGAEIRSGFVLDSLGWTGTKIEAELQIQKSRIRDPLTRSFRRISNDLVDRLHVSMRHDVEGRPWGWGVSYTHRDRAKIVRPSSITRMWGTPGETEMFVENKNVMGFTMRLTALNLLGSRDQVQRETFRSWQGSPIARTEYSFRTRSPSLTLSISGKF